MLVALFSASVCGTAMADFSLTVLHTNDFHARFEPISKYDNQCGEGKNAEGKCKSQNHWNQQKLDAEIKKLASDPDPKKAAKAGLSNRRDRGAFQEPCLMGWEALG